MSSIINNYNNQLIKPSLDEFPSVFPYSQILFFQKSSASVYILYICRQITIHSLLLKKSSDYQSSQLHLFTTHFLTVNLQNLSLCLSQPMELLPSARPSSLCESCKLFP